MLCSRFLRHAKPEAHGFLFNLFERGHEGMLAAYDWSLKKVLRFRFAPSCSLWPLWRHRLALHRIPKGFLPSEDSGFIFRHQHGAAGHLL